MNFTEVRSQDRVKLDIQQRKYLKHRTPEFSSTENFATSRGSDLRILAYIAYASSMKQSLEDILDIAVISDSDRDESTS